MTTKLGTHLCAALIVLLASWSTSAREQFPGQYAQSNPDTRQWFRSQKNPTTGGLCCSEADGTYAEEDIRYDDDGIGHYWTRFVGRWWIDGNQIEENVDWMQVPDSAVIHDPNRNGAAVVWYYNLDGRWGVRCYSPGAKS